MAITTAADVANLFIYFSTVCGDEPVTNMRLNKLLWFAQGYYLAKYEEPLFDDDFEAWQYGPVIPSIYEKYKPYGDSPITVIDGGFDANGFAPNIALDHLVEVANNLDDYSTSSLVRRTHKAGSPWAQVTDRQIIEKPLIEKWFYSNEKPLVTFVELLRAKFPYPRHSIPRDELNDDSDYWENEYRKLVEKDAEVQ